MSSSWVWASREALPIFRARLKNFFRHCGEQKCCFLPFDLGIKNFPQSGKRHFIFDFSIYPYSRDISPFKKVLLGKRARLQRGIFNTTRIWKNMEIFPLRIDFGHISFRNNPSTGFADMLLFDLDEFKSLW